MKHNTQIKMINQICIELSCKNIAVETKKYCINCIYCINCEQYRNDENVLCEQCENNFCEPSIDNEDDYDKCDINEYNDVTNHDIYDIHYLSPCIAPLCTNFTTHNSEHCSVHNNCTNTKITCSAPFCTNYIKDNNKYCTMHITCATCDNKKLDNNIFCNICLYI